MMLLLKSKAIFDTKDYARPWTRSIFRSMEMHLVRGAVLIDKPLGRGSVLPCHNKSAAWTN